ncbi:hypothetical protein [Variovorax sp. KK3]|uniref:hypothetical protein n=1 Tax=Variovorax sp. KK3 TaxID=1855728 RepID=UPI0011801525|nr:hypothetical protein [Variovorax sp. KK3]
MRKPEINVPGFPYDFHAIPLWIEPNLWSLENDVHWRKSRIALLYFLSMIFAISAFFSAMFVCLGLSNGFDSGRAKGVWLPWAMSVPWAPVYGLGVLWDFVKAKRKLDQTNTPNK